MIIKTGIKAFMVAVLMAITLAAIADYTVVGVTPTERMDNSPLGLSEISGFNMYCGATVGNYPDKTFFPGATLPNTTVIIPSLAIGTHYCVLRTLDIDGRESDNSNYVTLINDGKARPKPMTIAPDQVFREVTTLP